MSANGRLPQRLSIALSLIMSAALLRLFSPEAAAPTPIFPGKVIVNASITLTCIIQ